MAYFPVGLAFTDQFQYARRVAIGLDALTGSPAEDDATLALAHVAPLGWEHVTFNGDYVLAHRAAPK
jgi:hypothetical protein